MSNPVFASALSTHADFDAALRAATDELLAELDGATPDLLTAFVSHHYGPAIETLGPRVWQATGAQTVIGCTGESIVGTTEEIERGPALSLWAGVLPDTELRPFTVQARRESETTLAFTRLPEIEDAARSSVLVLADPYTFPMSEYLQVLNERLPGVAAFGGMASGGTGAGQNLLFTREGVVEGGLIGVVIEGEVAVRSIVSQGCRPVGKPLVITACKEHFIQKLGGTTAVKVLMETLQELEPNERQLLQARPFLGLAVDARKSKFDRGDFIVRHLVGIDTQQGALAVGDSSVRVGQTVQFLVRDAESAGQDLQELMRERGRDGTGPRGAPLGALVFSCNGRGSRFFPAPNHDITCVQSAFDERVPAAGFFAMGEIGPVGGRNFLHGFTASVALFHAREHRAPAHRG